MTIDDVIKQIDEDINFNLRLIENKIEVLRSLALQFSGLLDEFPIQKDRLLDEITRLRGCIYSLNYLKEDLLHKVKAE